MGNGFQFLDIIFFALIAAFVILRLRSVLGKRTGHEQPPSDPFGTKREAQRELADGAREEAAGNVVHLPGRDGEPVAVDTPLGAGLTQIKVADPSFDPADFQDKCKAAFEYIVEAYAAGDTAKLKPLLTPDVYDRFAAAIKEREDDNLTLETNLVRIKDAEPIEASMSGRTALITVKYTTEQINVTLDSEGRVVDGDPDHVAEVVDIWTYERNTRASNPNWLLSATETPQ